MDDFVIFHNKKEFLWNVKSDVKEYLQNLKLCLHENKCRIFETSKGIPFLGLVISSNWRRLKRGNVTKIKRRLRIFQKLPKITLICYRPKIFTEHAVNNPVFSFIHLSQ